MPYKYPAERFLKDPVFPLLIRKATQKDLEPIHTHEFVELVYVSSGHGDHLVRREDENGDSAENSVVYRISAGDVFVIAPGEQHHYQNTSGLEIYNVLFMPGIVKDAFDKLSRMRGVLEFLITEPLTQSESRFKRKLHLDAAESRRIKENLDVIAAEIDAAQAGHQLLARDRLVEVLILIGRAYEGQESAPLKTDDMAGKHASVQKAIAFMESKFADSLSLDEIAHQAFLSQHHFCRLFKDEIGVSPWEYLTQIRLEEAKRRLVNTDESVTNIALETGFCDSSHFARMFKRREGCSPSAYRKAGNVKK